MKHTKKTRKTKNDFPPLTPKQQYYLERDQQRRRLAQKKARNTPPPPPSYPPPSRSLPTPKLNTLPRGIAIKEWLSWGVDGKLIRVYAGKTYFIIGDEFDQPRHEANDFLKFRDDTGREGWIPSHYMEKVPDNVRLPYNESINAQRRLVLNRHRTWRDYVIRRDEHGVRLHGAPAGWVPVATRPDNNNNNNNKKKLPNSIKKTMKRKIEKKPKKTIKKKINNVIKKKTQKKYSKFPSNEIRSAALAKAAVAFSRGPKFLKYFPGYGKRPYHAPKRR